MQKQEPGTTNIEVSALALRTDLITRINWEQSFLLFEHQAGERRKFHGHREFPCQLASQNSLAKAPEVSRHPHRFGDREFRFGTAEIGHIHAGVPHRGQTETVYQQESPS